MRYEDASGSFSAVTGNPDARDDADVLPAGSHGPATGNTITGAGTISGVAGADVVTDGPGKIVGLEGATGSDTSDGGNLHVGGRFGDLSMDTHGNYKYTPNVETPNGARDVFRYTLADNSGARDAATLTIEIGREPQKIDANAQQIIPGPDGVVTLPPGVELSDVHVVGRNLVIDMPDGTQMIIVDGAVFVPQLVLNGVEVPATNVAALLVDSEPQPAAGIPQSSGGNFDVPVPPLDPGVPLGDLIPPTELVFTPPEFHEVGDIIDREPEAGTISVQLDDDAKAGGNPGGTGDDADSVNASGFLPGSGGDGALTWDLSNGGAPSGFSYVDGPNGSILVQQVQGINTVTVLTITIDPTDGSYTVVQNAAILHPTGDNENNVSFVINYTVTDSDGDVAPGTLNINVDDDTPTVSVTAGPDAEVSLTTHDAATIGAASEAVSTTANFSGVFTGTSVSPGADGAGSGTTSGYALSTTGGASGLSSHGVAINLYNVAGVIVGSTSATAGGIDASNTVFTVSTTNTGIVTLTQFSQIDHTNTDPSPTGAPFSDHGISLTDGSITLTRSETVVDRDGDSVTGSAAVGIGANLHFLDDGPTIGLADRGEPSLTVDETVLGTNATASFAANFSASFGADGPAAAGSITYALGISAPGANSGIIDVATGSAIVLVQNGSVVEGHVGNAAGALAFTVSVNAAGDVTLDQIRAVQHPDGTNPDDSVTLANDNLVTLTATAHDFDGDTASSTLNIGTNLNFEDDGPSISPSENQPSLTVDETDLTTNASASFAGVFTSAFGADGAGMVTYGLGISAPGANSGLIDVATGSAIVLVLNAGVVEGHVGNAAGALAFTVSINAAGDVTLDQIRAVTHPNAANPDDSVTLGADNLVTVTATVTDRDGDSATATANIGQNLNFEDDGPSITLSGTEASLTVDETVLATNATASFASAFTPVFGADGAGTVTYALSISAPSANSGLVDVATGSAIVLVQNGTVVEGHVGTAAGALAFTVSVNAAGDVTLDQIRAVQHPNTSNPDDSVTLSADSLVALTATVTDRDGDQATATLNIGQNLNFEDDGPSISASSEQPTLTVDETILATNATASFAGVFTSSFGADGAGTVTYALGISAPGANSGLTDVATGSAIVLVQNGAVVEGHVGNAAGALAFTVSVDSSGNVTLDQIRAVVHPDANNANDSVTLGADNLVTLTATVTDKDGDHQSATANIGQNLNFLDDGPSINANGAQPTLTVDETVLATNASASFAGVFNSQFGADGAGTVTYALGISAPGANSGLVDTLTGSAIVLVQNGLVVEGHVGNAAGALAFTVTVDASGNVTLDQIRAVVHPNTLNPDDSVTLSADNLVTLTATVTDKDGDHTSATANIGQNLNFEDDGPSANNDSDTITSGGTVATGNVVSGVGTNEGAANADAPGADGFGSVTTIHSNGSGLTDTTFAAGVLSVHGSYGTLEIDANGNYTYTRDGGSPGNVNEQFTYTYVDKDGDPATATLTITINDAAPNLPDPALVQLDDDALTNGNAGGTNDDTDSAGTPGTLVGTGGDGTLTYSFTGSNTLPAGFTTNPVDATHLQVLQGATVVLTITLNTATGSFSVVQNHAIDHPAGNTENNDVFGIGVQVTDADGDSDPATITINVDDDTPTVILSGTNPSLTVDETVLATNATASFAGMFTDSFGADGAAASGSVAYSLAITGANGVASGLTDVATGSAIVLVNNAGVIEGHVATTGGALAFTVSVDASGNVTLDQIRAVSHPDANNPNDSVTLANDNLVTLTQTITDHDGDQASATANIGQNLNFLDDGPSISLAAIAEPTLTVDETILATNATAAFAASFTSAFGADGAGAVTYALTVTGGNGVASGLTDVATGSSIVLVNNAGVIEGHVGNAAGALAFTVSVNAGGDVTLDQIRAVTHPDANNPNDSVSLSADNLVVLTATVTDKDGDHQSAALNIGQNLNFLDDGPSISVAAIAEPTLTVDETTLATNASASFAANFTSSFGADGAGTVTYALTISSPGVASGLIDVATGSAIVLVNNAGVIEGHVATAGGALAFTVSVNAAGSVTLDQIRAVQHPDANNANDSVTLSADNLVVLTATVTDKDGDHSSAAINIGTNLVFQDDGPSISVAAIAEPTLTVDETTLATNASASFAANFTSAFGADGAGAVTYALGISAPLANSGLVDVATGQPIVLVNNAGVIEGHVTNAAGALAFTVTVNAAGNVTLDQIRAISHPNAADPNDSKTLSADNLVTLTATVTDKDGDHQSASINIGTNLVFQDDGPSAAIGTTGTGVSIDESAGVQGDSNDVAGPLAQFAAVANKGVDPDMATQFAANTLTATVNSTGTNFGADGGTVGFSLNVSAPGVDSGLNTTDGHDILLTKEGSVIVGRVSGGADDGKAAFAISIDSTGHLSMVEWLSINHPNAANPDDSVSIANGAILAVVTATDGDNDTSSASTPIGSLISFQDSAPIMTAADNINIQNSGDVAANGAFAFNLGADGASTDNNVISAVSFSAVVNGVTVQTTTPLTQVSEDSHTATFNFSFTYGTGGGTTATDTGTITIYKDGTVAGHPAGTYSVDLANTLSGITTVSVQDGGDPVFYNNEHIGIVDVSGNGTLFMQFTGYSAMTGTSNPFGDGDTLGGTGDDVHISSTAIGVHGNALQPGEVIDFEFLTSDPGGVDNPPQATAGTAFIQIAQFNGTEDMIVVLKLADPSDPDNFITRTVVVQASDVLTTAQAGFPTPGTNEGLIIFQPSDYIGLPGVPDNYQIAGMQIAPSSEALGSQAGEIYNFNGALNAVDNTTTTFAAAGASDNDVIKITNIGAQIVTTVNQTADLTFNVTVKDGDGDSIVQTVVAHISDAVDSTTPIVLGAGVTTISQAPLDTKTSSSVQQPLSNSVLIGAIAAAGLDSSTAAAAHDSVSSEHHAAFAQMSVAGTSALVQAPAAHTGSFAFSALSGETVGAADVQPKGGSSSHLVQEVAGKSFNAGDSHEAPAAAPLLQGTEASAQSAPAQSSFTSGGVGVPSAAMLAAANAIHNAIEGQAHNTGDVGRVLFDALAGGGHGPNIDAVIDAVANQAHGGAQTAIEALASHGPAAVSGWDMTSIAGFTGVHAAFTMEHMAAHMDAAPAAA